MKCLCGFEHDDGSTALCPSCKTLQHGSCYNYVFDNEVDIKGHYCVDCRPRPYDEKAVEWQKQWLQGAPHQELVEALPKSPLTPIHPMTPQKRSERSDQAEEGSRATSAEFEQLNSKRQRNSQPGGINPHESAHLPDPSSITPQPQSWGPVHYGLRGESCSEERVSPVPRRVSPPTMWVPGSKTPGPYLVPLAKLQ